MSIQMVTDSKGKRTAVIVSIADWEEIQKRLNTEKFFDEFSSSINAIQADITGKKKLKSARELVSRN